MHLPHVNTVLEPKFKCISDRTCETTRVALRVPSIGALGCHDGPHHVGYGVPEAPMVLSAEDVGVEKTDLRADCVFEVCECIATWITLVLMIGPKTTRHIHWVQRIKITLI